MKIRHVVFSHRIGLRWYFVDTEKPYKGASYFLSLNPLDIKYLFYGIYILYLRTLSSILYLLHSRYSTIHISRIYSSSNNTYL